MTDAVQYFTNKFQELEEREKNSVFSTFRRKAFGDFTKLGVPLRHEEWKYTRISNVLREDFEYVHETQNITPADIKPYRLPGHENCTELVLVNGVYNEELSSIRDNETSLVVLPIEDAAKGKYAEI